MKKILVCIYFISFIFIQTIIAEQYSESKTNSKERSDTQEINPNLKDEEDKYTELPLGFRAISLGMEFDATKTALKEDSIFGYRGERDISLLAGENRSLIETQGSYNIKRAWFQFYEEKLNVIIIQMDTDRVDYYSIYTALCEKYGEPENIDPKKAVWTNETVSMVLERPLLIKYIDMAVFNTLLQKTQDEKTYSDTLRQDFINEF